MAPIAPQYSPEEVDEAGRTLVLAGYADPDATSEVSEAERLHAVEVVSQWRASHARPLNTFRMNLRRRVGNRGIVAQRLKRLPSIVSKLERLPRIRLSDMQDIGGCRAIVPSADDAFNLAADLVDSRMRHALIRRNNYIDSPRGTGYRGLHLIYAYNSDRTTDWQGLQVEIQIRSQLQHQWATAVETVGAFVGNDLKSNLGHPTWLRFFALMSSVVALREGYPIVPNTPLSEQDLVNEIRMCSQELGALDRLSTFQRVTADFQELRDMRNRIAVLELNLDTGSVFGFDYRTSELSKATEFYSAMEERSRGNPRVDVVLVYTDSLNALRRAYPNYFMDIGEFRQIVSEVIEET